MTYILTALNTPYCSMTALHSLVIVALGAVVWGAWLLVKRVRWHMPKAWGAGDHLDD